MSSVMQYQRDQWLAALEPLNQRIVEAARWLAAQATGDERIERLRTHPGIGLLTALGLVHTLEPISRFSNQRKVAAYVGFDPKERSSGEKKRYLGIGKGGSQGGCLLVSRFPREEECHFTDLYDPTSARTPARRSRHSLYPSDVRILSVSG